MNKILIAAVAVLGFAGVAAAQEAPVLTGNYSANVLNDRNGTTIRSDAGVDYSSTASITNVRQAGNNAQPDQSDINFGR